MSRQLDEQVMDRAAALARVGGDLELLKEIAVLFLDEYPRALDDIHKALAARDAKLLDMPLTDSKDRLQTSLRPPPRTQRFNSSRWDAHRNWTRLRKPSRHWSRRSRFCKLNSHHSKEQGDKRRWPTVPQAPDVCRTRVG